MPPPSAYIANLPVAECKGCGLLHVWQSPGAPQTVPCVTCGTPVTDWRTLAEECEQSPEKIVESL